MTYSNCRDPVILQRLKSQLETAVKLMNEHLNKNDASFYTKADCSVESIFINFLKKHLDVPFISKYEMREISTSTLKIYTGYDTGTTHITSIYLGYPKRLSMNIMFSDIRNQLDSLDYKSLYKRDYGVCIKKMDQQLANLQLFQF